MHLIICSYDGASDRKCCNRVHWKGQQYSDAHNHGRHTKKFKTGKFEQIKSNCILTKAKQRNYSLYLGKVICSSIADFKSSLC